MKTVIAIFLSITIIIILIISCEKYKDPFSALNKTPGIEEFSFASDSLKFKLDEPFRITLKYEDDESQKLIATFKFLSGHGDIFHTSFKEVSKTNNTLVFEAPSSFDDRLNFIPDTTGKIEIELELSDQVKLITKKAETFFFDNLKPVARFSWEKLSNVSPYVIEVDASASNDPDGGKIEWYYWRFDDGTPEVSTEAKTNRHTYQQAGSYSVKLKVVDNDGGIDSTISVISTDNQSPVAILQVEPTSGKAPLTIRYTATNSIDPDGKIVLYRIDFDDGSSALDSAGTHIYNTDKVYQVSLKVQDNLGQTGTAQVPVTVATPPVAILKVTPIEGPFPLNCTIDGTDSYDPLGGKIEHFIHIDGELIYNNVDSVVHTFDAPQKHQVRLVVTNERNSLTDQKVQSVNVINLNPIADFTWYPEKPQPLNEVKYTSTSTDSNLTDFIAYYKWTFPDGDTVGGRDKSIVFHTFSLDYTPYAVTLEVRDKFDSRDSITKIIPK